MHNSHVNKSHFFSSIAKMFQVEYVHVPHWLSLNGIPLQRVAFAIILNKLRREEVVPLGGYCCCEILLFGTTACAHFGSALLSSQRTDKVEE